MWAAGAARLLSWRALAVLAAPLLLASPGFAQTDSDSRVYTPPEGQPDTTAIRPATPDTTAAPPAPSPPPVALPPPASGDETGIRIRSVRAAGFSQVDSIVVIRTFGLRTGDAYSRDAVGEGVRRLFQSGLYTDVSVTDAVADGGVALTVNVTERPRVHAVRFEGEGKIDESTLKGKLTVAEGQLLDQGILKLDEGKIADAYAEEGYARAKVASQVVPFGPGTIDVAFSVEPGEKVKVRNIVIHQDRAYPGLYANELKDAMKSETPGFLRGGVYKPSNLEEDHTQLRLFMRSRGYKDAVVDSIRPEFQADGKGVVLHVHVRPGERYRFGTIQWAGNASVGTDALQAVTAVVPNAPYSEPQIHKTLEGAYTLYQELGYLYLSIDPQFVEKGSVVDVNFVIQEGARSRIADLQIVGNTRTKENVIRREALVRPGDVFRRSTLIRTQRDIFALGFFEDVTVDYAPTGDSADINLTLRVQEKQTGTASAGAGFASSTGLTGFLELGHNNLFGNGQSIRLHLERGGKRSSFELSFTDPWFRDTPLTVGFSLFNTEREYDVYDRRDVGGGVRFGRPIPWPDYSRGLLAYDLRNVTLKDFDPPLPGESGNLTALRNSDWPRLVSSVSATFSRVSTDNPFYAGRGSRLVWTNTFAGGPLGGVEQFYKGTLDLKSYSRLTGRFVLMLRGRTGFLGGSSVPEYERFRLGGTTVDYLRGYEDYYVVPRANITRDALGRVVERYPGGRRMLIAGAEIQFPVAEPLHGLLFFDAGNTWNSTREVDLGDLRRSIGFGARFEVPALGRIGFDVGYGLDREEGAGWRTHFQLGNTL